MNWTPFLALLTGAIVGVVFNLTELPVPAPAKLAGVTGIIGIYAGYNLPEAWNYLQDVLVG
ncbi:MAG: XapX domain-containing protein [Halobacteriales archaeon]|jgi:XapX domain-containing protein